MENPMVNEHIHNIQSIVGRAAALLFLLLFPGEMFAGSKYWFYPKATVAPTSAGKVYISKTSTSNPVYNTSSTIEAFQGDEGVTEATIYCYGQPDSTVMGDCYTVWTLGGATKGEGMSYTMTITSSNTESSAPTNPNNNIVANFAKIRVVNGTNGTASISALANKKNQTIKLTASPASNYSFAGWVVDGTTKVVSKNNPWQFKIGDNKVTYKPTFETTKVTVSTDGNGAVKSSNPHNTTGDQVTLSAEPVLLYKFKGWVKNNESTVCSTDNPMTVTATDEATNYKATFEKSDYAYYRVQNTSKYNYGAYTDKNGKVLPPFTQNEDYLTVVDDKSKGTHNSPGSLIPDFDLHALSFIDSRKWEESILCNPATVLRIEHVSGKDYDVWGQGVNTYNVARDNHFTITADVSGDKVVYTLNFMSSNGYLQEWRGMFDNARGSNYAKYWAHVMNEDDNYLGLAPNEKMTDGTYYYQTLKTSFPYSYSENVSAFYVKEVSNNKAKLVNVLDVTNNERYVPANSSVILRTKSVKPEDNKLLPLMPSSVSKDTIPNNLLWGTLLSDSATYYYNGYGRDQFNWSNLKKYHADNMRVLSINSKGVLGFYKLGENTNLKPNRAWLHGDFTGSNAKSYQVVFDDSETTGIQEITPLNQEKQVDAWYTLQGMRVEHPTKGIYIHRGKKIIIK